jgi:multiple sugar transport system substrate-binding protein
MKASTLLSAALTASLLLSACGNGTTEDKGSAAGTGTGKEDAKAAVYSSKDPVKLRIFLTNVKLSDQQMQELIVGPVQKLYPNISLELVRGANADAEKLITSGDFPDIIFTGLGSLNTFDNLGLAEDFDPYVKKYGFNLSDFEDSVIQGYRKLTGGKLKALPYSENFSALIYNKEIFDQFAVPYPKDGMVWEDVIALGRSFGNKLSGTDIMPVCPGNFAQYASPLSLPLLDTSGSKAVLATDKYRNIIDMFKTIHEIPGNKCGGDGAEVAAFRDGKLAMFATNGGRLAEYEELTAQGWNIKWDLATYPEFKEAPGKRRRMDHFIMMMSSLSNNKDAAFSALAAISSKEQQLKRTRTGALSVFKDAEVKRNYATDLKVTAGKNMAAIGKQTASEMVPYSINNSPANKYLEEAVKLALQNTKDTNTLLREAEEKANRDIASLANK